MTTTDYKKAAKNLADTLYLMDRIENCPDRVTILGEIFCCENNDYSERCKDKNCYLKQKYKV